MPILGLYPESFGFTGGGLRVFTANKPPGDADDAALGWVPGTF